MKTLPQRGWRQGDFMDNSNVHNLSPLVGSQKGWTGKQDSSIQWTEKVTPNLHFSPNSKQLTQKESCSKSTFSLNSRAYWRTAMIINWYQLVQQGIQWAWYGGIPYNIQIIGMDLGYPLLPLGLLKASSISHKKPVMYWLWPFMFCINKITRMVELCT